MAAQTPFQRQSERNLLRFRLMMMMMMMMMMRMTRDAGRGHHRTPRAAHGLGYSAAYTSRRIDAVSEGVLPTRTPAASSASFLP